MTVPFSDLLAFQSSGPTVTDREEPFDELSGKEGREKALNLGIDDKKMHMVEV